MYSTRAGLLPDPARPGWGVQLTIRAIGRWTRKKNRCAWVTPAAQTAVLQVQSGNQALGPIDLTFVAEKELRAVVSSEATQV